MNDRSDFAKRLREERKKKNLTQKQMADFGGVSPRAYCNYEDGTRAPDTIFLTAIAANGIDVAYLITGQRAHLISEENPGYTLRPDQKALLDNVEHCAEEDRKAIHRMALMAAEAAKHDAEKPKKTNNNH